MLERDAYRLLTDWKDNGANKALLVDGARQIGKTFLVEEFARREFEDCVKVDFLRDDAARLVAEASDAEDLFGRLSLLAGHEIVPGRTLVFLDEVQEAENLVTLAKYLVADGRFRLAMSGSLLGLELKHVRSFPVGFLRTVTMHPLGFAEFARAMGVGRSIEETLRGSFCERIPVEPSLHERLTRLFRIYVVVGGMPEAVVRYAETSGDLGAVRSEQRELVKAYRADISKYAGSRTLQVMAIYDAIPGQLDKENKRFEMGALRKKATFERYANDFAWLVGAGAAVKVPNVTEPRPPLRRTEEANRFKLYLGDTGMLMSRYPVSSSLSVIAGDKGVNCGGVYENVVAQELVAAGVAPRYFRRSGTGEVDFVAEGSEGGIVPVEVKSGKTYNRHVALNNLLKTYGEGVSRAYVLCEGNVSVSEREAGEVVYLPLYMLPLLAKTLVAEEAPVREEIERAGFPDGALIVPPARLLTHRAAARARTA